MNIHYGEVFRVKKKKKCSEPTGIAFVMLGLGIALVCIFPSKWMVIILALALVAAGILLMKR